METSQNTASGNESKDPVPQNPGAGEKSQLPDANKTKSDTLPSVEEEKNLPVEEKKFGGEHSISPDHAEPTGITGTSNDNFIEGEYIDVGGGD